MSRPFKPADELLKHVSFRTTVFGYRAYFDNEEIGGMDPRYSSEEEAVALWKEKVLANVRTESSTCVLRTACGCTALVNLPDKGLLKNYLIPLFDMRSARMKIREPFDEMDTYKQRAFRFYDQCDKLGHKILEEVL